MCVLTKPALLLVCALGNPVESHVSNTIVSAVTRHAVSALVSVPCPVSVLMSVRFLVSTCQSSSRSLRGASGLSSAVVMCVTPVVVMTNPM